MRYTTDSACFAKLAHMILDTSMSIYRPSDHRFRQDFWSHEKSQGCNQSSCCLCQDSSSEGHFLRQSGECLREPVSLRFSCVVCARKMLSSCLCAKRKQLILFSMALHIVDADGIVCRFQFWGHPESFPYLGEFQRYSATFCHTAKHSSVYSGVLHKRQQISKIQASLYSPKQLQNPFGPSCF